MQQFNTMRYRTLQVLKFAKVLSLCVTLILSLKASAQNFILNNNGDTHASNAASSALDGSGNITLRSAVEAATAQAGTHIITIPASITTINLSLGQLSLGSSSSTNITINGPGMNVLTINQTTAARVFTTTTQPNFNFTLQDMTITYTGPATTFSGGGGALLAGGTGAVTTVNRVKCTNWKNQIGNGGAIGVTFSSVSHNFNMADCVFDNNKCGGTGGAVTYDGLGTVVISGCTFTNNSTGVVGANTGGSGGALSLSGQAPGGTYSVTKCTFLNNNVENNTSQGGALIHINGQLTLNYNRFVGNTASTASVLFQAGGSAANTVDARNNWWGHNTAPTSAEVSTGPSPVTAPDVSTWLQLKLSASPATLCATTSPTTSLVTASFLNNSAGTAISVANLTALVGLSITYSAVLGTLSGAQTTIQASGTATVTFTSNGTAGAASVNGVVDNVPNNDATAKASITVNAAPSVTTNPTDVTVCAGANATFTAAFSGTPVPTVQWQVSTDGGSNFNNVAGATSTTLSFTTNSSQNGNQYHCVATNTCGSATTTAATLTVNSAPAVTTNPTNATVCAGANATFTAAFNGTPTPTVQWQVSTNGGASFNNIAGATSTTLTFATSAPQNGNQYRCVATNTCGSATTTAATLTVNAAPSVTTHPTNVTVCAGANATFTAAFSGTPAPGVQWQVSTDGGATFNNVTGATSTTLTFATSAPQNGNQYHCVATNTCGSATTSAATLTVNSAPAVTTNPTSATVCSGANATFTAAFNGTPTPTVQWQVSTNGGASFNNIAGATSTTLTFATSAPQNGNQYRCVATNTCGSATTTAATLTVNTCSSTSPSGTGAANPSTVAPGSTTLLTVTVTPGTNPTSTGITVTGDLTSIGGSATQTFLDDGLNGDVTAGDNIFSYNATVSNATAGGAKTLPVTIGDAQARTGNTSISLTVSSLSVTTYYPKTTATDLSQTNNWTDAVSGTGGTSPSNFTSANQLFNITRNPVVIGAWTISGGSNVVLSVTGLTFNPTSSLTVGAGSNFDFGGNNNYSTTFKSIQTNTAYLGQVTGTISNATNVTTERFISSQTNRAYRLLGPSVNAASIKSNWQEGTNNLNTSTNNNPVPTYGTHITGSTTGANGFDATQSGQGSLYTYNQSGGGSWVPAVNTSANLNALTGYLLYIRGDRSIDLNSTSSPLPSSNTTLRATGTLLTGTQSFTGPVTNGFSLVTNPYVSAIDWSKIYANNTSGFSNYYTYWDPNIGSRGGYVTVASNGIGNPPTVSPDPLIMPTPTPAGNLNIQSGQAFFVNSIAASAILTIREIDKSSVNNIDVFRTTSPASQKFTTLLYYTDAEHGRRLADGVTSLYDDSYNKNLDGNDAEEISNFDENIAIARQGKHLSIEERPTITASDTLSLFMSNMKQQVYEFEFNPSNLNPNTTAQLVDNFTGNKTYLDVTSKTVVPFTVISATASSAADRFYILFKTSTALPVTLTSIKAYQKNTGIAVEWTTQQESNIDHYEVERSQDAQQFAKIGSNVAAKNSSTVTNYSLFDATPFSGLNYYRIKIIDKSGQVTYSSIVKVTISSNSANFVTVYPNPLSSNVITLQMNLAKGSYTISLTNKLGQLMTSKVIEYPGGSSTQTITPSQTFAAGVYQLKVTGNDINITQQVIKN